MTETTAPEGDWEVCARPTLQLLIPMAHLFVAIFLIVFGINALLGVAIPAWILGILALIAGILLLVERVGGARLPKP
jgi:hypothetical protein